MACAYGTANWTTRLTATSATLQLASGTNLTVNATVSSGASTSTAYSNMYPETLSIAPYSGSNWLRLATGANNANGESITITFPQTMYCIEFYVQDVDTQWVSGSSKYSDWVSVSGGSGFTVGPGSASTTNITYSGGTASITTNATSTSSGLQWDYTTSTKGLVKFSAASASSFTLTYKNTNAGGGTDVNDNDQQVWVSPIRYSTVDCVCT